MRYTVIVVGAGLAGTATATALARGGVEVHLLHDPSTVAASDVPLGVLTPYPAAPQDPVSRLRVRGACYTHALLQRLEDAGLDSGRRACGTVLIPHSERARRRNSRPTGAAHHASAAGLFEEHGIVAPEPALMHPAGACVDPTALRRALLQAAGERVRSQVTRVAALARSHDGSWCALGSDGSSLARGDAVVLAAGPAVGHLWPAVAGELKPVRGQATAFGADDTTRGLGVAVSGGGYVTPTVGGRHWAGATFQHGDTDTQPASTDDDANACALTRLWPGRDPGPALDRFVAIRAATRDHLPRIGHLDDGVWINAGHGAHGLATAPLSGARIARSLLRTAI